MTRPEKAGYIVQDKDGYAIFGFGQTADEAWAMAVDGVAPFHDAQGEPKSEASARAEDFVTYPASAKLLKQVATDGGAIAWTIHDGIACAVDNDNPDDLD